jgi:glyoxylase-like metal-dependent hydrolase (beta-lactamase superfamily II)
MTRLTRRDFVQIVTALVPALGTAAGQAAPEFSVQPLTDKLSMLGGAGGNIAILRGPAGLLLVDSGTAPIAAPLIARIHALAPLPVSVLINTHYHFDHVGANPDFGRSGARIIAHENTRRRLSEPQHRMSSATGAPPLDPAGLPNAPFTDSGSLSFAGQTVAYRHLPPAHTDGDATVRFENANVYHTGDLFFQGMYPYIDYAAGGSIEGMVSDTDLILKAVDSSTRIIPGHGPLATRDQLRDYRDMLSGINERVSRLVREGKTLEQTQAAEPTKPWDEKWGNGFLKPAQFVELLWNGKTKRS